MSKERFPGNRVNRTGVIERQYLPIKKKKGAFFFFLIQLTHRWNELAGRKAFRWSPRYESGYSCRVKNDEWSAVT